MYQILPQATETFLGAPRALWHLFLTRTPGDRDYCLLFVEDEAAIQKQGCYSNPPSNPEWVGPELFQEPWSWASFLGESHFVSLCSMLLGFLMY